MTNKQTFTWWVYIVTTVVLLYFLGPALISAADSLLVLLGTALLLAWGVWSWYLWVKPIAKRIAGTYREL